MNQASDSQKLHIATLHRRAILDEAAVEQSKQRAQSSQGALHQAINDLGTSLGYVYGDATFNLDTFEFIKVEKPNEETGDNKSSVGRKRPPVATK